MHSQQRFRRRCLQFAVREQVEAMQAAVEAVKTMALI